MQKSLIAVAVGGALAVIGAAPALAQNATVNVYGTFYGQYGSISNGAKTGTNEPFQRYDHFQNPGSEIGFRGEEKLGGGLSAWFQCNTSIDYRGSTNAASGNAQAGSTWCTRNSALGMKGGFGNVFYGNWQTPWNRINQAANVGSNDTGVFGNAHIISGTSTTTGVQSPSSAAAVSNLCPSVYRRRQNNLLTYETPNFSGFTAMGAVTSRNYASAATSAVLKARLYSLGGQYSNGPVYVGVAYEKHSNFYSIPVVGGAIGGDDRGWTIGGSYTFSNNLKLGAHYNDFKASASLPAVGAIGGDTKVKTWHIGIDWMISGPHGVRAAYSRAGDVSGASIVAPITVANPTGFVGTPMNARPASGPNTGVDMWQIRYVHMLSKRTELTLGYSKTNNRNAATYETGGTTSVQYPGADSSAIAASMRHSF